VADLPLSPDRQKQLAFYRRIKESVSNEVAKATFPMYAIQKGEYVLLGTGVLFQIASKSFGLTAAHVLDDVERCLQRGVPVVFTPGEYGHRFVCPERIDFSTSVMPDSGDRCDDPVDVGFIELSTSDAEVLGKTRHFLNCSQILLSESPNRSTRYLVFGYPKAGSECLADEKCIQYQPLACVSHAYTGDLSILPKFHRETEIILNFTPDKNVDDDEMPSQILHPKGISGCGIWRLIGDINDSDRWKPEMVKLVGIEHTWDQRIQAIRGTRIGYVIAPILQRFPELRPAMDMAYLQFQ
jgi:hypothetical protein